VLGFHGDRVKPFEAKLGIHDVRAPRLERGCFLLIEAVPLIGTDVNVFGGGKQAFKGFLVRL
jgi:hypothetical protein